MNRSVISKSVAGVGAFALATVGFIATAPSAAAAEVNPLSVTLVARACDAYDHVFGNEARNNIRESLQDLPLATNYGSSDPMSITKESEAPQGGQWLVDPSSTANCQPLTGFTFQFGDGIIGGSPASPSTVDDNSGRTFTTGSGVPQLDSAGNQVGTAVIDGANTVVLNDTEKNLAAGADLWVQGGTKAAPLLAGYGFATLRCATDNLNGDNVEFVEFKNNARHVYCFYYAIKNPPDVGNIVIKKVVDGDEGAPNSTFVFDSNISFDSNEGNALEPGQFALKDGQSFSQERGTKGPDGQGAPWTATETTPPTGFTLTDINCVVAGGSSSTWSGDETTRKVEINVAKGETVTCTFTNTYGDVPTDPPTTPTTPPTNPPTNPSTPSTPDPTPTKVETPEPVVTPEPATTEAAVAVGLPAPGKAAPQGQPQAATVPEMGTVPSSVPAGDGSTAPNGLPGWAWLLVAVSAIGAVTATAKIAGARR